MQTVLFFLSPNSHIGMISAYSSHICDFYWGFCVFIRPWSWSKVGTWPKGTLKRFPGNYGREAREHSGGLSLVQVFINFFFFFVTRITLGSQWTLLKIMFSNAYNKLLGIIKKNKLHGSNSNQAIKDNSRFDIWSYVFFDRENNHWHHGDWGRKWEWIRLGRESRDEQGRDRVLTAIKTLVLDFPWNTACCCCLYVCFSPT